MRTSVFTILLALASPSGYAELYRWTDSGGRVHYGDRPAAGAGAAQPRPELLESANTVSSAMDQATIDATRERARERSAALSRAHQAVLDAQVDYAAASLHRERASEPLPGERLGTAGGGSRLAPSYFERLAVLDDAVARANARLHQALAARNALR